MSSTRRSSAKTLQTQWFRQNIWPKWTFFYCRTTRRGTPIRTSLSSQTMLCMLSLALRRTFPLPRQLCFSEATTSSSLAIRNRELEANAHHWRRSKIVPFSASVRSRILASGRRVSRMKVTTQARFRAKYRQTTGMVYWGAICQLHPVSSPNRTSDSSMLALHATCSRTTRKRSPDWTIVLCRRARSST